MPKKFSQCYQLDQSISVVKVFVWIFFHFYSNFDRTFCKQTVETRRLVLVCTVCLRPTNRMLGLYGLTLIVFLSPCDCLCSVTSAWIGPQRVIAIFYVPDHTHLHCANLHKHFRIFADVINGDYCWYVHEDYYIRQTTYCSSGCCRDYGDEDEICCFEW